MNTTDAASAGMILACGVVMAHAGDALRRAADTTRSMSLEALIGSGTSALGIIVIGGWVLTLLVAVSSDLVLLRGPSAIARAARRCTPAVMRRLSAALLGINLIAAPSLAQAAPSGLGATDPAHPGTAVVTTQPASPADDDGVLPKPGVLPAEGMGRPAPPVLGSPFRSQSEAPPGAPAGTVAHGAGVPTDAGEWHAVSPGWRPAPMPADGGVLVRTPLRTALDETEVVVAPGDSLWSITQEHLGSLSTAADVAEAWPAWYDTNRAVIGNDPSLLLPGQVLRAPHA